MPADASSMMYFSAKRPKTLTASLGSTEIVVVDSWAVSDSAGREVDERELTECVLGTTPKEVTVDTTSASKKRIDLGSIAEYFSVICCSGLYSFVLERCDM